MKHERGQTWVRQLSDRIEVRVCLDPTEGRFVSFTSDGPWIWTLKERSPVDHASPVGIWFGWERLP